MAARFDKEVVLWESMHLHDACFCLAHNYRSIDMMSSWHPHPGGLQHDKKLPFAVKSSGSLDDGFDSDIEPCKPMKTTGDTEYNMGALFGTSSGIQGALPAYDDYCEDSEDDSVIVSGFIPPAHQCGPKHKLEGTSSQSDMSLAKKIKREDAIAVGVKKESKHEANWTERYNEALHVFSAGDFQSLQSSNPLYSWLNSQMNKVKFYYEHKPATSEVQLEQIKLVHPLVQEFVNCRGVQHKSVVHKGFWHGESQ